MLQMRSIGSESSCIDATSLFAKKRSNAHWESVHVTSESATGCNCNSLWEMLVCTDCLRVAAATLPVRSAGAGVRREGSLLRPHRIASARREGFALHWAQIPSGSPACPYSYAQTTLSSLLFNWLGWALWISSDSQWRILCCLYRMSGTRDR